MAKPKARPQTLFGFGAEEGEATPSDVAQLTLAAIRDLERVIKDQQQRLAEADGRVGELVHRQSELVARVAALEALVRDLARD